MRPVRPLFGNKLADLRGGFVSKTGVGQANLSVCFLPVSAFHRIDKSNCAKLAAVQFGRLTFRQRPYFLIW